MNTIQESLLAYGLNPKEAAIYTYLLQNRDCPAYDIAKETRIPRTTVYKTLEELQKQGIVSSWVKNGVQHFLAENPEKLRRAIKTKEQIIEQALPEMLSMFKLDSEYPSAKLYEGKEGVKQVFENILDIIKSQKVKQLYVFSDYHLTEQFPQYFSNWRKRKNDTGAFTHLIVPSDTPRNEDYTSNKLRETRVMPASLPFDGSIDICGSHVAFFSFKENQIYSVTIDSPIISEMLTKFFRYIWQTLEQKI